MLALSIRFSETSFGNSDGLVDTVNSHAEVARSLVTKRVWEGPVELSTLQSLCLLSLVDFTSKQPRLATAFRVPTLTDISSKMETHIVR